MALFVTTASLDSTQYRCDICGSPNVQANALVNLNTEKIEWEEIRDYWCNDCDDEQRGLIFVSEQDCPDMDDLYAHIEDDE